MDLKDLLWTHDTIATEFNNGRQFEDLIQDLMSGEVDPLRDDKECDFLIIECTEVTKENQYFTKFNRRLWCLNEFQRRSGKKVRVRVNVEGTMKDLATYMKFFGSTTTHTDGQSVQMRKSKAYHARPGGFQQRAMGWRTQQREPAAAESCSGDKGGDMGIGHVTSTSHLLVTRSQAPAMPQS